MLRTALFLNCYKPLLLLHSSLQLICHLRIGTLCYNLPYLICRSCKERRAMVLKQIPAVFPLQIFAIVDFSLLYLVICCLSVKYRTAIIYVVIPEYRNNLVFLAVYCNLHNRKLSVDHYKSIKKYNCVVVYQIHKVIEATDIDTGNLLYFSNFYSSTKNNVSVSNSKS